MNFGKSIEDILSKADLPKYPFYDLLDYFGTVSPILENFGKSTRKKDLPKSLSETSRKT
jgi:hypothetical protein